ncbi:MAG: carbon storage regulator CsrA, partial [Calditrichia bacterium]|nr:carbon storage regulator CsrA [Calditrichia bacterium]
MLVLTRKLGQKIVIDETISVTIISIDENRVQLGIEAPRRIPVYRLEVVEKIQEHNRESSQTKVDVAKTFAQKL